VTALLEYLDRALINISQLFFPGKLLNVIS